MRYHLKRQWYAFLFTDSDNHDVLFDKGMMWFFGLIVNLFMEAYHRITNKENLKIT